MTKFLQKYLPLYAPEGAAGGAAGTGDAAAVAAAAAAAAATGAGDPWHKGVDAETLGHWQNKGWKVDDPKEIAIAATKQAREAEKFFGVPADQLLKLPKADAKPEDIKAFWAKLGAAEAKDIDLSAIKRGGEALDEGFATAMRDALAAAFVPKDKAVGIAAAVVKALESADTAKTTISAAKLAEERAALDRNWGTNKDFNLLKAMEGARRLGPEFVKALETAKDGPGYAAIMEGMRKIGMGTTEDTFIERGAAGGTGQGVGVTTREGAAARMAELQSDAAWCKRLTSGDAQAKIEFQALTTMMSGEAA